MQARSVASVLAASSSARSAAAAAAFFCLVFFFFGARSEVVTARQQLRLEHSGARAGKAKRDKSRLSVDSSRHRLVVDSFREGLSMRTRVSEIMHGQHLQEGLEV